MQLSAAPAMLQMLAAQSCSTQHKHSTNTAQTHKKNKCKSNIKHERIINDTKKTKFSI